MLKSASTRSGWPTSESLWHLRQSSIRASSMRARVSGEISGTALHASNSAVDASYNKNQRELQAMDLSPSIDAPFNAFINPSIIPAARGTVGVSHQTKLKPPHRRSTQDRTDCDESQPAQRKASGMIEVSDRNRHVPHSIVGSLQSREASALQRRPCF